MALARRIVSVLIVAIWWASSTAADELPMTFKEAANGGNCNDCIWVAAEGRITESTAEEFRRAVEGKRSVLVRLNSLGGSALGGIALGYAFRAANVSLVIGSTAFKKVDGYTQDGETVGACVSACALAFMGGLYRNAGENELGVHRVFLDDPGGTIAANNDAMLRDGQIISALIVGYMQEMGIEPNIISAIAQTDRDVIRYLTTAEMKEWGILNKSWRFSDWSIDLTQRSPIAYTLSEFGPHHTARLEYSCDKKGQRLSVVLRLPDSYIKDGWSGIGNMADILAQNIEVNFLKDRTSMSDSEIALVDRRADDQFVSGTVEDAAVIQAMLLADEVKMTLYPNNVTARQYEDFEMMEPTFSLRRSTRALQLLQRSCR